MKKSAFLSLTLGLLVAGTVSASDLPELPKLDNPKKVEQVLTISNVFVSEKMDKEDASIFLSGHYPNSCYSWSRATVNEKVEEQSATEHVIRAYANVVQGICLMVLTPFTKEIDLGTLPDGDHTIKVINGDGTFQQVAFEVK